MTGSSEQNGWTFTEETLKLLSVSVAQIRGILNDGGQSVDDLSTSFVSMADTLQKLINKDNDIKQADLENVHTQIQQGIVAFQFYDRISQRLEHVSQSLINMGEIIGNEGTREQVEAWQNLQSDIKKNFTMEAEKKLFDQIMAGVSIEDALQKYSISDPKDEDDTIELF
jgi:hemoglobin-like flavoprotein